MITALTLTPKASTSTRKLTVKLGRARMGAEASVFFRVLKVHCVVASHSKAPFLRSLLMAK